VDKDEGGRRKDEESIPSERQRPAAESSKIALGPEHGGIATETGCHHANRPLSTELPLAPIALQTLNLDGAWTLRRGDDPAFAVPATVPGTVHLDLIRAGRIPDPFVGDNEKHVEWIGRTAWTWSRKFDVSAAMLAHARVLLRCEGLDTLATVRINGADVGCADNMHRTWEFDAKPHLRAGSNEIEIAFLPILEWCDAKQRERFLYAWGVAEGVMHGGGAWVRKSQCNFGWDWGPKLATCGIWKGISLVAFSVARIANVHVRQRHEDGAVALSVGVAVDRAAATPVNAEVVVRDGDRIVARGTATIAGDRGVIALRIAKPKLWWPNGMGEQPLYSVETTLLSTVDEVLDRATKRVGLRTLRLVRENDAFGQSFRFEANGVPFFAKGANWIPADAFVPRVGRADYERLLRDAAHANMNMLRVWGGGIYERDEFYDLCDELGLCAWQDFMFACSTYPTFDGAWMANVRAEATENVRRLRDRACLALWCGNNELEQGLVDREWTATAMSWADYGKLFDSLLAEVVAAEDPDRDYWPCSPHTPVGDRTDFNNPDVGDAHLWSVWHGRQPFEWYRTAMHRFCSEFGFQSFPEPKTVRGYAPADELNLSSYTMEHHQRSPPGNPLIMHYMLSWFRLPKNFEMLLWLSQVQQGLAMKYAVEHWRRNMPRCMGALYWQLNDCWPIASWSSIDWHGRWKALQYMARRFFAPLLVSVVEDLDAGTMAVHVTSDLLAAKKARLRWALATTAGETVRSETTDLTVPPNASHCFSTLDFAKERATHGDRTLIFRAELWADDRLVSHNLATFARPKHMKLEDPKLQCRVEGSRIVLRAERPTPVAWVTLKRGDAVLSDNFVSLAAGEEMALDVVRLTGIRMEELAEDVEVFTLFDTWE